MKIRFVTIVLAAFTLSGCVENITNPPAPQVQADATAQATLSPPVQERMIIRPGTYDHNSVLLSAPAGFILTSVSATSTSNAVQLGVIISTPVEVIGCEQPCKRQVWRIDIYMYGQPFNEQTASEQRSRVTVQVDGVSNQSSVFDVIVTNKG